MVDDPYTIRSHVKDKLRYFLDHLNNRHPNIRFTEKEEDEDEEEENNGRLAFLDISVERTATGRCI